MATKAKVPEVAHTNVWAVLSLVFGFLFPLLGIIFGIVALNELKNDRKATGHGLAVAGIIIGSVFILLFLALMFLVFYLISKKAFV